MHPTSMPELVDDWKSIVQNNAEGTRAFNQHKFHRAVQMFTAAVNSCAQIDTSYTHRALLKANRACAQLRLDGKSAYAAAIADAEEAAAMCDASERPYYALLLSLVRARDQRLTPNFQWLKSSAFGLSKQSGDWVAKMPVPPSRATLQLSRDQLIREEGRHRRSHTSAPDIDIERGSALSSVQKVETPRDGDDRSLLDVQIRRLAGTEAIRVEAAANLEARRSTDSSSASRTNGKTWAVGDLELPEDPSGADFSPVSYNSGLITPPAVRAKALQDEAQRLAAAKLAAQQAKTETVLEDDIEEEKAASVALGTVNYVVK